ncbi:hypothetical protein PZA11_006780 [Diplocarpon coronariae]
MGLSLSPNNNNSAASENTPLLGSAPDAPTRPVSEDNILSHESSESTPVAHHVDHTPLPKLQILLLCLARLVEPMAFFCIFPFVNQMIRETGNLEEADVGFYSGFIESMFSFTQMLLMIQWGRASDRIGRKPVLVFSMAGVAVGTASFGLSKTIWQMVLLRCFAGVFSGTVVTIRAMITENSTPRTQARAFSFFAFSGNMGIFLGPVLGGILQSPARQYGGLFESIQFFRNYPYALPTFATGSVGVAVAVLCAIWVKETLKKKPKGGDDTEVEAPMSVRKIIRAPDVAYVLFIYGHVMLLGLGYTAISTLLYYTSIPLGGYGFSPLHISFFLATVGIAQGIWLLLFFPILHRKYGTGNILRGCYLAWPFFFAASPLCNFFLRRGWTTAFWIVAPTLQIVGSGVAMGFTCVQLALNDVSPSSNTLGTLNALALTLVSAIRTVGPAVFSSMFAFGAHSQFLDGYLIWVVLIFIALIGLVSMRWYPERAEGRPKNGE